MGHSFSYFVSRLLEGTLLSTTPLCLSFRGRRRSLSLSRQSHRHMSGGRRSGRSEAALRQQSLSRKRQSLDSNSSRRAAALSCRNFQKLFHERDHTLCDTRYDAQTHMQPSGCRFRNISSACTDGASLSLCRRQERRAAGLLPTV